MVGLQLSYGAQISIRRLVITPRLIANQPRLQEVTSPDQEQVCHTPHVHQRVIFKHCL